VGAKGHRDEEPADDAVGMSGVGSADDAVGMSGAEPEGDSGAMAATSGPSPSMSGAPGPGMSGDGVTGGSGPGGGGGPDEPPTHRTCGVMDVHRRLLMTSPSYVAARARIETQTLELTTREALPRLSGIARIPVVVHVVWNTPAQNISRAQIDSQITVLNADFRAANSDVSKVPSVFQPLVEDARIEFFLATVDPAGNPTDGITRRQTSTTSFGSNDAVKFSARGGQDAWPADGYLNIWVCQLGGGLLGYAQFPGGPAQTDGVVVTHTGFGTTGTAAAPFDKGRTATHEVGHFLNLFHIWGDDGTGCTGTDEVADTPNQAGPNTGKPTFPKVSCGNGPNGDLFMDYMDYVDDDAMVMFSKGQVARMTACLETVRAPLVTTTVVRPAPAGPVVSWSADRLDAFVLGIDHAVFHKWWDGSAWGPSVTGYENVGGIGLDAPEVASWGPDRLDVFVRGANRAIFHKWWDGSAWAPSQTGYENLGGIGMSPPRVATWGPNRLDVFVLGANRALHHKWWDGSAWSPSVSGYEALGGVCMSPPAVVSWGENRLDVFVIGIDNALYHKWWDGSAWAPAATGWEYLGGVCASEPVAVSWAEDRLDLFVVGTNGRLYHKSWDGSAWSPSATGWELLGGVCTSTPTAVAWGPDRLDVFVTGTNSALYHKWWDGSAWSPSPTGYTLLGGLVGELRTAEAAVTADLLPVQASATDGVPTSDAVG